MRRRLFLTSLATLALLPGLVRADVPGRVYAPGGVALGGTDPVGYFTEGKAVPGSRQYALMWMGATWLFASAENRALFEMDPHRYAPAFGGYCAYSVSRGYVASSSPEAFTIHEGRLYLLASLAKRSIWARNIEENIAKAKANWPNVAR